MLTLCFCQQNCDMLVGIHPLIEKNGREWFQSSIIELLPSLQNSRFWKIRFVLCVTAYKQSCVKVMFLLMLFCPHGREGCGSWGCRGGCLPRGVSTLPLDTDNRRLFSFEFFDLMYCQ